jgi:hypothetical protein
LTVAVGRAEVGNVSPAAQIAPDELDAVLKVIDFTLDAAVDRMRSDATMPRW